jgi:hypothetical protein
VSFHSDALSYDDDDSSLAAAELLEAFAHDLPAKETFPTLLPMAEALMGGDWKGKRAGLECLGRMLSAAPVSFARYLPTTTAAALAALADANPRVAFQGLQLAGQVCNLTTGPEQDSAVQKAHAPALAAAVGRLVASPVLKVANAACGALVSFCRGSSNDNVVSRELVEPLLGPLLAALSEGVLSRLSQTEEEGVCVLAASGINALACLADAAGPAFAPHYAAFMPGLLQCMTANLDAAGAVVSRAAEENGVGNVRGAAMEAATIIGKAVGGREGPFLRDAETVMQLVMSLLAAANGSYQAERDAAKAGRPYSAPPLPISMEKAQR